MIEASRRHSDTRRQLGGPGGKTPNARVDDGEPPTWIRDWENEGGRSLATERPRHGHALEWSAFTKLYFPGRRRHDFEALKAYEAYRDDSDGPRAARAQPQAG
jgi:hypothetical protein